ncbi:hypothetical protein TIFTF001_012145 [Ficus carica]|uniref:Retrotransposon gag domain-containing protein n=1 Tax=Ficus carica TaxID=3494 RepID=A0AA88AFF9_FICCA|nr:hypothetical protein TIFTF001_012145 [Ficus carica]
MLITRPHAVLGEHGYPTRSYHLTRVLSLYLSATGAIHLLLQHVTSPPAVTYSDRSCPCRRRRQPPYCPLYPVRDTWHQSIGPIAPSRPDYPTTLGVVAGGVFGINILALEGGHPPFQQSKTHSLPERPTTLAMDEGGNQNFQDLDNPAPTGSQSTRRPPRQRGHSWTEKRIMHNSPKYNRRPPSQRRAGRPGRLADHETLHPWVTGGVIGHTERASGGSSRTEKNRVGCAREAVILRLPDQERDLPVPRPVMFRGQAGEGGGSRPKLAGSPPAAARPAHGPTIRAGAASYDGSTDADEHLENYQSHMLIQNANEDALCKSFCLTLTGAARKLGASHMFGIKQGEAETLKKYLERFDKAVVQVESCTDDTLIQAFREGVKDTRLVWTLAYDKPPTFAHLRGIA